jgi:hypothetical protein
MGFAGAAWLLLMSALASGLGGYLAGRLRAKWIDIDADEAFFRDTAHGFLAWAVATVISAAILTSAASSMVGTSVKATAGAGAVVAGAAAGGGAAGAANAPDLTRDYFVDMMFRGGKPTAYDVAMRHEAAGILNNALTGEMGQADRTYLAQGIAQRTGMSAVDAEQLVTLTVNAAKAQADAAAAKAREAAETARQATAYTALWVFVSLLLGAFCASLAATWGGRQRDVTAYQRKAL